MNDTNLTINEELRAIVPPLSEAERAALEEQLVASGCRTKLPVWNDILLDNITCYEICSEKGIPFEVVEVELADMDEARKFRIAQNLARRHLKAYVRAKLALTFEAELSEEARERMLSGVGDPDQDSEQGGRVLDQLAKIAGVSRDTIYRVREIERRANDDAKAALVRGEMSVNAAYEQLRADQAQAPSEGAEEPRPDGQSTAEIAQAFHRALLRVKRVTSEGDRAPMGPVLPRLSELDAEQAKELGEALKEASLKLAEWAELAEQRAAEAEAATELAEAAEGEESEELIEAPVAVGAGASV
jgi:hypothetical protein